MVAAIETMELHLAGGIHSNVDKAVEIILDPFTSFGLHIPPEAKIQGLIDVFGPDPEVSARAILGLAKYLESKPQLAAGLKATLTGWAIDPDIRNEAHLPDWNLEETGRFNRILDADA